MSLKYVHSLQLTRTPRPTRLSQLSFRLKLDHAMFRSHDKCWPLTTRSVGRFLMPVRSPHAPSSTPAAPPQTLRSTLMDPVSRMRYVKSVYSIVFVNMCTHQSTLCTHDTLAKISFFSYIVYLQFPGCYKVQF